MTRDHESTRESICEGKFDEKRPLNEFVVINPNFPRVPYVTYYSETILYKCLAINYARMNLYTFGDTMLRRLNEL